MSESARDVLATALAAHINWTSDDKPDAGCIENADTLIAALAAAGYAIVPVDVAEAIQDNNDIRKGARLAKKRFRL